MFYRIDEKGKIIDKADFKYADDCLETDKNIVVGYDGALRFEEETKTTNYLEEKTQFELEFEKKLSIDKKKERLDELRKDFEHDRVGFFIKDLEEKKEEYRTLLNEIRWLQGKEPKEVKNAVEAEF